MHTGVRKYSRITPHGNAEFESTKERGLPRGQACKHRRLVFVECLFYAMHFAETCLLRPLLPLYEAGTVNKPPLEMGNLRLGAVESPL